VVSSIQTSKNPSLSAGVRGLVEKLVAQMPFWVIQLDSCGLHEPTSNAVLNEANEIECLNIVVRKAHPVLTELGIVDFKHDEIPRLRG
jgi:hypothetical protein